VQIVVPVWLVGVLVRCNTLVGVPVRCNTQGSTCRVPSWIPSWLTTLHELQMLKWRPFKNLIVNYDTRLRATSGSWERHQRVMYFGDTSVLSEEQNMANRLTAYVFVIDTDGKVRWRSSGQLLDNEKSSLCLAVHTCIGMQPLQAA
jgi:ATP10 protein